MQSTTVILGLIIAADIVFFFFIELLLMERRWKRLFEEIKADSSSQPMWMLMKQQMDRLRRHMSDGLNKNISLLTEQLRVINEQVNQQLQLVNQQLQSSSGQIGQRLDNAAKVIGEVITSSPAFIPAARQEMCNAAVPLETATAYFAPVK